MLNLLRIIIRRVLKPRLISSPPNLSLIDRLANTKLIYRIEEDSDSIWIGIDVDETRTSFEYDIILEDLNKVGLEFIEPQIEHDYISGYIQLI